jgi:hypothetical protein
LREVKRAGADLKRVVAGEQEFGVLDYLRSPYLTGSVDRPDTRD